MWHDYSEECLICALCVLEYRKDVCTRGCQCFCSSHARGSSSCVCESILVVMIWTNSGYSTCRRDSVEGIRSLQIENGQIIFDIAKKRVISGLESEHKRDSFMSLLEPNYWMITSPDPSASTDASISSTSDRFVRMPRTWKAVSISDEEMAPARVSIGFVKFVNYHSPKAFITLLDVSMILTIVFLHYSVKIRSHQFAFCCLGRKADTRDRPIWPKQCSLMDSFISWRINSFSETFFYYFAKLNELD